jgi:hypothetical protein
LASHRFVMSSWQQLAAGCAGLDLGFTTATARIEMLRQDMVKMVVIMPNQKGFDFARNEPKFKVSVKRRG